jgi:hypothetical protein
MNDKGDGAGSGARALTVCAYICGDTGPVLPSLEDELLGDLQEMEEAGATSSMAVLVQLDKNSDGLCYRFILAERPSLCHWEGSIGAVDMGSPDTLRRFLDWCVDTRPAKRYALIIGSHGSGPRADDVYGIGRRRSAATSSDREEPPRAIAFDDGARSFMDLPGLRRALTEAVQRMGQPFGCVLMDACYMATWETVLELRGLTDSVIASPEAVPGPGMPYAKLLGEWSGWDGKGECSLDESALSCFADFYGDKPDGAEASLVALDMRGLEWMQEAMDALGAALVEAACARPMIAAAVDKSRRSGDADFVYLSSLFSRLNIVGLPAGVRSAAAKAGNAGILTSWVGPSLADGAYGLTAYLPRGHRAPWYDSLAAADSPWGDWVKKFTS